MLTQPHFDNDMVYHEGVFDKNDLPNPYIINSWNLTEIKDALTNRVITFNYSLTNLSINNNAGISIAFHSEKNYSIISHKFSRTEVPQLSSIILPDQHQVSFNYKSETRIDMNGDKALASVDITYQSRGLSKSFYICQRRIVDQINRTSCENQFF